MSRPRERGDAADRLVAATCFDTNLAVIAGAGTGKTSLLVERVLVAVGSGVARIEDIAAITFTIKAAGEMRERLAAGLERLLELSSSADPATSEDEAADRAFRHLRGDGGMPLGELRSRALAALTALDGAVVETIHGFCARLLREHPVEAGVDPAFEVDQGEHYEAVLEETWADFLAEELGTDPQRLDLWRRVLEGFPLATVEQAARALAAFSIPDELLRPADPPIDACRVYAHEIRDIAERSARMLRDQRGLTRTSAENLEVVVNLYALILKGGLAALREAVDGSAELRERLERRTRYPRGSRGLRGVDGAELERLGKRALRLAHKLANIDEGLMTDLVEAIAPFAPRAREELLRRGFVGFDGLLVLVRDMLRDHPRVRERVKRRYRLLLVDEFQDTDPLQYEIVFYLAERRGESEREAHRTRLEPGKLFVVGDPKQSIYRFRGADYTAFRLAVERVAGGRNGDDRGRLLHLTSNFRSVPEVLDPVNRMFEPGRGAVWEPSPFQPEYVGIESARSPAGAPAVELWTVTGEEGGAARRRIREGEAIADEIVRLIETEGIEPGSISILLRAFGDLAFYLRPLRERGVPFVVDGGREFLRRPEVGHLIATLRALSIPSDEVALLAFLRSPAGGVPDTELARHAASGGRWYARAAVDEATCPALARALGLLRSLEEATRDLPADQIVHEVLRRTGLPLVSAVAFEGAQRVANLAKLAAAAAGMAREGKLSLIEVIDALEAERSADVESDSPLADEGVQAVRVMTIHKAKGLENDIVIVPDLARQEPWSGSFAPFEADVVTLPDGTRTLALQARRVRNAAGLWFHEDRESHERAEGYRVLYVAMTRARRRLVLLAGDPRGKAPWIEALARWGYDASAPGPDGLLADGRVLHVLKGAEATRRARIEPASRGAPDAVEAWERAWAHMRRTLGPPFRRPSGIREEEDEEEAVVFARRAGRTRETARLLGSVVHRTLERWDRRERQTLVRIGRELAEEIAPETADEVVAVLSGFARSSLAERLQGADVGGREIAMLLRREGEDATWGGSIDLLYRDGEGRVVVADYKTDTAVDPEELRRRYSEQLRLYAEAVQRAYGLDYLPRAELWLVREGRILEI